MPVRGDQGGGLSPHVRSILPRSPGQTIDVEMDFELSKGYDRSQGDVIEGTLTWTSSRHTVRTPLVAVVGLSSPKPSTAWETDDQ